jgi:hypothetical protein
MSSSKQGKLSQKSEQAWNGLHSDTEMLSDKKQETWNVDALEGRP